jgi:hypothetical protein
MSKHETHPALSDVLSTCNACSYQSDDPLDLGEALWLAHWQLNSSSSSSNSSSSSSSSSSTPWAEHVAAVSLRSLDGMWEDGYFDDPLKWRLAFREFGTSIGLQASLCFSVQHTPTKLFICMYLA